LGGREREREREREGGWVEEKRLWAKTRIEKGNKRVREEKSSKRVENVKTGIQQELENGK
jgi:hypothetical protein